METVNLDIFKTSKNVCLISHLDPDADALTSLVLMKNFLKQKYSLEAVDLFAEHDGLSANYLPILEGEILNPQVKNYDTAVILDAPNLSRLGKFQDLFNTAKTKIVIDHHATNAHMGDMNFVDNVSSTCEVLYCLLRDNGYNFSDRDWGLIYAGIITDTNNFSVGNIGSETFSISALCLPHINSARIYDNFFSNNTLKNMQILARAIDNLQVYMNDKLLITHISKSEHTALAIEQQDYIGIINRIAGISGNAITAFIYPKFDGYYVSLRAKKGYDVSLIAKAHNGGGHVGASGFLTDKEIPEITQILLNELRPQIDNHKDKFEKLF